MLSGEFAERLVHVVITKAHLATKPRHEGFEHAGDVGLGIGNLKSRVHTVGFGDNEETFLEIQVNAHLFVEGADVKGYRLGFEDGVSNGSGIPKSVESGGFLHVTLDHPSIFIGKCLDILDEFFFDLGERFFEHRFVVDQIEQVDDGGLGCFVNEFEGFFDLGCVLGGEVPHLEIARGFPALDVVDERVLDLLDHIGDEFGTDFFEVFDGVTPEPRRATLDSILILVALFEREKLLSIVEKVVVLTSGEFDCFVEG